MSKELKKQENAGFAPVNLESRNLPDLSQAQEMAIDFASNYWTPENVGEQKRVFFLELKKQLFPDVNSGEMKELYCAAFIEQNEKGDLTQISNGSSRLVGIIESNEIKRGTPLIITYKGKKKNKTNSFSSDSWSVKPLIINQ